MPYKTLLFCYFSLMLVNCSNYNIADTETTQSSAMKKYNKLTEQEEAVIIHKATDPPYTGEYYTKKDMGIYVCRQCNNRLYKSDDKFDSHCGWPSFDDEIDGAVKRVDDADGLRTEIVCNNCGGHLGHVFIGEGFTQKNTRHCVNTSSILFYTADSINEIPPVIR